jgi:E3 ubiquitin-protein ligase HERC4
LHLSVAEAIIVLRCPSKALTITFSLFISHLLFCSRSGAVFGFGKNTFGQLGINDQQSKHFPTQLKTLRRINVRFIACGDDFSVFLTLDGGVFTCGSGTFGQLGHGNVGNEILPRMVMELMGSTITQVTCGRRHTLALVPSRGRIYGFGIGGSGQLANRNNANSSIPQVVIGPWVSPSGVAIVDPAKMKMSEDGMVNSGLEPLLMVSKIFAGGDHCIVAADRTELLKFPADYRLHE